MPSAAAGVALTRQTRVAAATAATQPGVALPPQPVAVAQPVAPPAPHGVDFVGLFVSFGAGCLAAAMLCSCLVLVLAWISLWRVKSKEASDSAPLFRNGDL